MDKKCSICGKPFDMWDMQEDFCLNRHIGYGSKYDNNILQLNLCCGCFDKLLDHIIPQCKINPIMREYDASPAPDCEIYAYKGIFWIVDEENLATNIPYMFRIPVNSTGESIIYDGMCPPNSKRGDNYNHRLTWNNYVATHLKRGRPFNCYPRGRVEISPLRKVKIFINPDINTPRIISFIYDMFRLAGKDVTVIADSSEHYGYFKE